jgi:3-oxoacyl-[acyl-carrier-protein] synthase II
MAEIAGLRVAIGEHPVLTATKSMTGHLLGAAGALETVATVLAVHNDLIPPTINLDDPEDGLLDVATNKPRHLEIGAALNNSFGFGGHNVALIVTKP